jgi:hypothetical protein
MIFLKVLKDIEKSRKELEKCKVKYYKKCKEIDKIEKYLKRLVTKHGEKV